MIYPSNTGPHRRFNPFGNAAYSLVPGQGHFGPDALPGVRRIQPPRLTVCTYLRHDIQYVRVVVFAQDARWRRGEAVSLKASRDQMISLEAAAQAQMYASFPDELFTECPALRPCTILLTFLRCAVQVPPEEAVSCGQGSEAMAERTCLPCWYTIIGMCSMLVCFSCFESRERFTEPLFAIVCRGTVSTCDIPMWRECACRSC